MQILAICLTSLRLLHFLTYKMRDSKVGLFQFENFRFWRKFTFSLLIKLGAYITSFPCSFWNYFFLPSHLFSFILIFTNFLQIHQPHFFFLIRLWWHFPRSLIQLYSYLPLLSLTISYNLSIVMIFHPVIE